VRSCLHGDACWRQIGEPLLNGLRCGSEAASINDRSLRVERAIVTPDVAEIDPDRHLDLGVPAWDFSDEALRLLLHGNSLSNPVRRTCSSHLSVQIGSCTWDETPGDRERLNRMGL